MAVKKLKKEETCEICSKKIKVDADWFRICGKYMCSKKCADEFEKQIIKKR